MVEDKFVRIKNSKTFGFLPFVDKYYWSPIRSCEVHKKTEDEKYYKISSYKERYGKIIQTYHGWIHKDKLKFIEGDDNFEEKRLLVKFYGKKRNVGITNKTKDGEYYRLKWAKKTGGTGTVSTDVKHKWFNKDNFKILGDVEKV